MSRGWAASVVAGHHPYYRRVKELLTSRGVRAERGGAIRSAP
jgi:hypothetical protein